jgi:BirA family biotin operon repressor/biotin-[acetyl-CoA-carboxylase] ligase
MAALVGSGTPEGVWLRAEQQTAGRGRLGRIWVSPPGNFYGSTLVRLRARDPAAATLALVAGIALHDAVSLCSREGGSPAWAPAFAGAQEGGQYLKWPNDLLLGGAKLAGILLERVENAVVVGVGVNLAHHPDLPDRPTTSLAAQGIGVQAQLFAEVLAEVFARRLHRWRGEGLAPIRTAWLAAAHPIGSALNARLPDGTSVDGLFDGLDADGALILRLEHGDRRVIHAGDVFLL